MEATREIVNKITEEYLTSLDPHVPHYENVTRHLRHSVTSLTRKIILNDDTYRKEHQHPVVTDDENDDDNNDTKDITSCPKNHDRTNSKSENIPENSDDDDTSSTSHLSDTIITTMNAFLHNCTLALPPRHEPSPPPLSPRRSSQSPPRKKQSPSERRRRRSDYPQFTPSDILARLSLYARHLHRIRRDKNNDAPSHDDRVIRLEPVRQLSSRVDLLVKSYVAHRRPRRDGTVEVAGGSLRSVEVEGGVVSLMELIGGLTKELLGVEVLAPSVTKLIDRLISHYSSLTSTSLPLCLSSSPTTSATHHLPPLLRAYLIHLKQHHKALILDCDIESMLVEAIDDDLRRAFDNATFGCVGDVWEFCRANREKLEGMALPPSKEGRDCVLLRQAVRDLKRERIMVNGRALPVVESVGELVRRLTEAVNGGATSCEEETMDGSSNVMGRHVVEGRTIDRLTSHLLCAAGRTGAGGDAYFVVNALFGGDDVAVIPSSSSSTFSSTIIPSTTRQHSTNQKTSNENNDNDDISPIKEQQQPQPGGTIEIDVRLTSITIKCHGIYDIHPSGRNEEDFLADRRQPLIRLHAVTTEMISLQTVRARDVVEDVMGEEDKKEDEYENFEGEEEEDGKSCCGAGRFLLRERVTEMTGIRRLSIAPVSHDN